MKAIQQSMNYQNFFENALNEIKKEGRYRTFRDIERCAGDFPYAHYRTENGLEKIIVWCGNDYLGMGQNPDVLQTISESTQKSGAGAGGTRNISGTNKNHVLLEAELADLHSKEAALIFTSGYVANETTLSTLGKKLPDCVYFSDADNHASMIEGIRHSGADKIIFNHNDVSDLRSKLSQVERGRPKIIAFESIYSMDGDISPIKDFCDLAEEFNALTYIDEVHGVGMYGNRGGGITQEMGLCHRADIIQGTMGKAIGLIGGYIASTHELTDFIRSFGPGFIFTTSLPPNIAAGAVTSIQHLKTCDAERIRHQENANYLKEQLAKANIPHIQAKSHIVPVMVNDAELCREIAETLLHQYKIYVQPINYPTVPVGTERLRLTPSALHTKEMTDQLITALLEIWKQHNMKMVA